jgi:hypothetical protein
MPTQDLERTVADLERRLAEVERHDRSPLRFFTQYLLSPLLVAGVAAGLTTYYQGQLETQRNVISQYELVNKMLPQLVHSSTQVAEATRVVLEHVIVDTALRKELNKVFRESVLAQRKSELAEAAPEQRERIVRETVQVVPELAPELNRYDKALRLESSGFNALVEGDVEAAIDNFKQAEEVYPQFHNTSELADLLEQKRTDWDDEKTRRDTYQQVVEEYSWKAPKPQLEALRERAR